MRPTSATIRQLIKYGIVGASNFLISYAIYAGCIALLGVQYEISLAIAYVGGAINGYVLNRRWTFRQGGTAHARSARRYIGVQLLAFLCNLLLLHGIVNWLGVEKILGEAFVIPLVFLATYLPNRAWSFAEPTPV